MALTDTFVKQVKHTGEPTGDKYTDGGSMFLLVKAGGKYWRMDYSHADKRKTLALGIYPAVSLVKARQRRDKARELLAEGIDPNAAKQEAGQASAAANTFESVALEWMEKTAAERIESTQIKRKTWLEKDVFPFIGVMPIAEIGPRDVLGALRVMEGRGALDAVQRVKQVLGQLFRYAAATGSAERDVTQDLKGALMTATPSHVAARCHTSDGIRALAHEAVGNSSKEATFKKTGHKSGLFPRPVQRAPSTPESTARELPPSPTLRPRQRQAPRHGDSCHHQPGCWQPALTQSHLRNAQPSTKQKATNVQCSKLN